MPMLEEHERIEYASLTRRGQDAERTALACWTAAALSAAVLLSWAIAARSSALTIPVVFAIAIGFHGMLRGRQQVRWIGSYVEEFFERPNGPQWFTRVHRLQQLPGFHPAGDWVTVSLANGGVLLAVVLAWIYSSGSPRGDLMASIATGCGALFGYHSLSETLRPAQTDGTAMWRQVGGELREAPRSGRVASG
jgi:hypothetical protein